MVDLSAFITALEVAQSGAKYNPEVQKAAAGINVDDLKKAYASAEAQGKKVNIEDAAQSDALKGAFEFAAKLVMELQSAPGDTVKANLYVHYKIGNNVVVEKGGMFDLKVCVRFCFFLFFDFISVANIFFCHLIEEVPSLRLHQGHRRGLQRPRVPGCLYQAGR